MRIPRIYNKGELLTGSEYELDQQSAHHLSRVLRLKQDDPLILFNGEGGEYHAQLKIVGKKAYAIIQQHLPVNRESSLNITLLQGISKGERMDLVIQKSIELGVNRIIPVICQRTVVNLKADRQEKKLKHWQGILINACEQSGRTAIPQLLPSIMFKDLPQQDLTGLKLALDPHSKQSLQNLQPQNNQLSFLIGPEGGLTDEELMQSKTLGFEGIRLGPRVLRTETAAITALALSQTLWGDFNQ